MNNNQFTFSSVEDRFLNKVNKTNSCWLWTASKNNSGYGEFNLNKKMVKAHRVSWLLTFGEIPEGMCCLHKCDVRECVNPEHLFLGSNADNMADKKAKGRHQNSNKTHCKHGHEFNEVNTYVYSSGKRSCRKCDSIRTAEKRTEEWTGA